MAENLDISRGLIVAEAVMMGLAPQIGRQEAHDVVYDSCRLANEKGITLADALSADVQGFAADRPRDHRTADIAEKLSRPCARNGRSGAGGVKALNRPAGSPISGARPMPCKDPS